MTMKSIDIDLADLPNSEKWWYSTTDDPERLLGGFSTRDEAIEAALKTNDSAYIVSGRQVMVGVDDLFEDLFGVYIDLLGAWEFRNDDLVGSNGETPFDHLDETLRESLNVSIRAAARAWAEANSISPRPAQILVDTTEPELVQKGPPHE